MATLARRLLCNSVKLHAPLFKAAPRLISYTVQPTPEEGTAVDMIKYSNSLRDDESAYSEAVRILQQGLTFYSGNEKPSAVMASGRLQLSLATIHAKMSSFEDAADCLQQLLNEKSAPLIAKGAALEALTGLCLQVHQDKAAVDHAESFKKLWEKEDDHHLAPEHSHDITWQALALRRLVELADPLSITESMDLETPSLDSLNNVTGAAVLALAESSHVHGSFSRAKNLYEKAISLSKEELESINSSLSAISAAPEAVHVGAITGLGQLLGEMGKFEEAELQLTQALKDIEKLKGEKHSQVGVILSCLGNLYQQRGKAQESGEMLIIEGIYKRALELMKAPPLDSVKDRKGRLMEIVVLTRARLAATLAPASSRRSEVEKLKEWVEATWNSRPLPELGHLRKLLSRGGSSSSEATSKEDKGSTGGTSVVDIRLERVFYRSW